MGQRLIAVLALAVLADCNAVSESGTAIVAGKAQRAGDSKRGALVFASTCAACHAAGGVGGNRGPSLQGERDRLDYAALVSWVEDPQPSMPKQYPKTLSDQDVLDVASYVDTL
jgi:mono/diheme cytochrome c family protein